MNIKIMARAVGVCMAVLAQQAWAQENTGGKVELSPLNVSGEAIPAERQALEKPGAVSVNIRGLSGLGRVNMMVWREPELLWQRAVVRVARRRAQQPVWRPDRPKLHHRRGCVAW